MRILPANTSGMKRSTDIPLHRLSDRNASGISVLFVESREHRNPGVIGAHRDDHYLFFFQTRGNNSLMVDFEEVCLKGASVYCILPGQVHEITSAMTGRGWALAIDTGLVEEACRHVFEVDIIRLQPLEVSASAAEGLEGCIGTLYYLLNKADCGTPRSVHLHLASAYIGMIASLYLESPVANLQPGNRMAEITRRFRVLLKHNFKEEKSPAGYAEILNLSLSYLNECVKSSTGMPVSYWIQHEIILEAKRLLYYTSMTVKEIAFALGYSDHTYFSRMFLKGTGLTPGQFRRTYHG